MSVIYSTANLLAPTLLLATTATTYVLHGSPGGGGPRVTWHLQRPARARTGRHKWPQGQVTTRRCKTITLSPGFRNTGTFLQLAQNMSETPLMSHSLHVTVNLVDIPEHLSARSTFTPAIVLNKSTTGISDTRQDTKTDRRSPGRSQGRLPLQLPSPLRF